MDETLYRLLLKRLDDHPLAELGAGDAVLVAFESAGGGSSTPAAPPSEKGRRKPPVEEQPKPVYLQSIEAEGFRGIGEPATLSLEPGPGLTLVVGRNGSGKSSFAEALEMLLIGANRRWETRSKVWSDGWRNLHHSPTAIRATFSQEGRTTALQVTRRWEAAAELTAGTLTVGAKGAENLQSLGWTAALEHHRPFLSHNELGRILDDGPTKLYDALATLLGLQAITEAQETLGSERREAEKSHKAAREALARIQPQLAATTDERAVAISTALGGKTWDFARAEQVLTAGRGADTGELARLAQLSHLQAPEPGRVAAVVRELREAARQLERVRGTKAGEARQTADLLQTALELHLPRAGSAFDCPVCGNPAALTYEWRAATLARIEALRGEASDADAVAGRARHTRAAAVAALSAAPAAIGDPRPSVVDCAPARTAWQRWHDGAALEDLGAMSDHMSRHLDPLIAEVHALNAAAAHALEQRQAVWQPLASQLLEWLPSARAAQAAAADLPRLKAAEKWLNEAHSDLRAERFAPIAAQVQENWATLRQNSSVALNELRLEGAKTSRRLTLDVAVDGETGSALGVMSQGELNCLALSLFLPRATMPESPFRFLVIDDPVQAMDPAKVDGLAEVLDRAAKHRQVVVFTHDDRLADSVRRLSMAARIIEVTRRQHSTVELRQVLDPVSRYLEDARAVASTRGLPPEVVRVVPGFCRDALEAACAAAVMRAMLHRGRPHADVEAALRLPTTLLGWLALWRLGDSSRAGDVMANLNNSGWSWAADAVAACNSGSHGTSVADLQRLIRDVERLCGEIGGGARG